LQFGLTSWHVNLGRLAGFMMAYNGRFYAARQSAGKWDRDRLDMFLASLLLNCSDVQRKGR